MLIFKSLLLSEIPESWESNPIRWNRAKELILSIRATYVLPYRATHNSTALPPRPVNPKPTISPMLPVITVCGNCNKRSTDHTDEGLVTIDKAGFTKQLCFRTPDTFLQGTPGRDYISYETVTEKRYIAKQQIEFTRADGTVRPSNDVSVTYLHTDHNPKEPVTDFEWAADTSTISPDLVFDPEPSDLDPYEFALEYEDHTAELNNLDNWRDTTPSVHTVTLTEHQSLGITEHGYSPVEFVSKQVFVEGNSGFSSIQLLDLDLTKKYHDKLLNVYLDAKTGQVRIGSIRLTRNFNSTITATCVRNNCHRGLTSPTQPTVADLEAFTYSVIAHGNNHAANWLTTRPSWYKTHRFGCTLTDCTPQDVTCQHIIPVASQPTPDYLVRYLTEHNNKCTNLTNCNCIELLAQWTLTPKDYALLHSLVNA